MCKFFSCIATHDGRLLFTEQDSHSEIITRANLRDDKLYTRHFVRLEIVPPFASVRVDEDGTLPAWYEENREDVEARALKLARRVGGLREAYEATIRQAREAYEAALSKIEGYTPA